MYLDTRRFVASFAALLLVLTGSPGCAQQPEPLRPVQAPLPIEHYDAAFGARPETAQRVHGLIQDGRLSAVRSELPKLIRAASERHDEGEWGWSLVELAQIESAMFGPESALHAIASRPWPSHHVTRLALALTKASLQAKLTDPARDDEAEDAAEPSGREAALHTLQEAWSQRTELGQEDAARLGALMEPGNYPAGIRDSLRDLLSYQTAGLLTNQELWTPEEVAAVWSFDLGAIAGAAPEVLARPQPTDESVHPLHRAMAALADLEAWHRAQGKLDAAFEARLARLRILRAVAGNEARRGAIRAALRTLMRGSQHVAWAAEGCAELAQQLKEDLPDSPEQALEMARQGERLAPGTIGAERCRRLAWEITRPTFEATALPIAAPGRPSIRISYRNLRTLHAYAYASDLGKGAEAAERLAKQGLMPNESDLFAAGRFGLPSSGWTVSLSASQDYRVHQQVITPPLQKPGFYGIALSPHRVFIQEWGYHQFGALMLSDLILQPRQTRSGELIVSALSASNGKPMAGVPVILYQELLDGKRWFNGPSQGGNARPPCVRLTGTTDTAGIVRFEPVDKGLGSYLLVAHDGDQWAIQPGVRGSFAADPYNRQQGNWTKTLVATDRAIYRPGQTVHWKTFSLQGRGDQGDLKLQAGRKVSLSLKSTNDTVLASKSVTTNRLGTASGQFRLPEQGLRGRAWLETPDGYSTALRIEEYRRPTYSVALRAPGTRSLSEPLTLTGKAMFLYGRPLSKGTAAWEVRRERGLTPDTGDSYVVAAGQCPLDAAGSFSIRFDPRLDTANAGGDRLYSVAAKVVSLNGETQSASLPFYLGAPSVRADLEPEAGFFQEGAPARFRILRTDLDGRPLTGHGRWQVTELRQPDSPAPIDPDLSPDRMTSAVQQRMSYEATTVMPAWPDGRVVHSGSIRHGADGEGILSVERLPAGPYRLRYTTEDPFEKRYESSCEFVVAGDKASLAVSAGLWTEHASASAGSTLRVFVASGHPDQVLRLERYRDGQLVASQVLQAPRLPAILELPVTAADRGGFDLALRTFREHRELACVRTIEVPWNKTVDVSLSGAPDVIAPRSHQAWSARVRERDGTPVAQAEILATMVDRSLDGLESYSLPDISAMFPRHRQTYLGMFDALMVSPFREGGHDPFSPPPPAEPTLVAAQLRPERSYVGSWGWLDSPLGAAAPGALAKGAADGKGRRIRLPEGGPLLEADMRRNFAETALFLPHLVTDRLGKADFAFQVPDSVTGWNVNLLAVTPDLRSGSAQRVVQSRRDLMVHLTVPRFLRAGDEATLLAEVENTTARSLSGRLSVSARDALRGTDLTGAFGLHAPPQGFQLAPGESMAVPLPVRVPETTGAVNFSAAVRSGTLSDGEERALPILPSRLRLAEGRSATLSKPGQVVLSFRDAPIDRTRASRQLVLTVHTNPLRSLLLALPGLEPRGDEGTLEVLGRLQAAAKLNRLLDQDPGLRAVARKGAGRQTRLQPLAYDPNRDMLLSETPWGLEANGGGPGLPLLNQGTAKRIQDDAVAELADRQSEGKFAWFPGMPPSRAATVRVLEGLIEASRSGVSSVDPLLKEGLGLLIRTYREDPTYWNENGNDLVRLAYVTASISPQLRQSAQADDSLLRTLLDEGSRQWRQVTPDVAAKLALALHRANRATEAKQVWESVMDATLGTLERRDARDASGRLVGPIAGPATVLRTLLELNPDDTRAERLAERVALQMELSQQHSAPGAVEGVVALAEYLRHERLSHASTGVRMDYGALHKAWSDQDEAAGRQQVVIPLQGATSPHPVTVSQTRRGTTLATATWHYETDQASTGSQWPGTDIKRTYAVQEGTGSHRQWVPLSSKRPLRVGEEVRVRLEISVPYGLGQVCIRDPRPAGLEPTEVSSGQRWFRDTMAYEELRDNRTSFFIDKLSEGSHTVSYRMRVSMPGLFHVAPATLEPEAAPEIRAFSSGAQLRVLP